MLRRALIYGTLAAAGVAAWSLMQFALGWHGSRYDIAAYTAYVALIFPVIAIVLALRAARRERSGVLTFGTGMSEGIAVTVVLTALSAAFFYVYYTSINPGFNDRGLVVDPVASALAVVRGSLAAGLIITVVSALALRSKGEAPVVVP